MRQLHLVGFTSDQDGIILAGRRGSKTGGYVVTMDEEFLEQVDQVRRMRAGLHLAHAPEPNRSRVESALSPREMQTRLRGGRTVAQVAVEAGVAIEWVERFAAPVLAEQAAAVERAQSMTMRTQRRGYSDRALGPSVLRNLADRGVRLAEDEFDELWSAFQLAENEWVIRFRHRWRGRELDAEWVLDEGAGSLTPSNRQATELGFVDPGRHAPPVKGLAPVRVLRRAGSVGEPSDASPTAVDTVVVAKPARAPRPVKAPATSRAAATSRVPKTGRPVKAARARKTIGTAKATTAKKTVGTRARRPLTASRPASTAKARKQAKPVVSKAKTTAKVSKAAKSAKSTKASGATKAAKATRSSTKGTGATKPAAKAVRRERPLKAARAGTNGSVHAAVRTGGAGSNSRNGSAPRRAASLSRAGGNGSRRSRG